MVMFWFGLQSTLKNFTVVVYKENDILCKHPIPDFEVIRSLDTQLHSCIMNGSHFERNMWASVGKNSNWGFFILISFCGLSMKKASLRKIE